MMLSMSLVQENYPWTRTMSGDLTDKMSLRILKTFKTLAYASHKKKSPETSDLVGVSGRNAGRDQRLSQRLNICLVVSRLIAAIDVVSGMPFGQERTQFCELPQPSMPLSSSMSASRRSCAFISPVGCALNRRTCEI